jgi:hypothetical protein
MACTVCFTICFTICLFISPDLDGHRAPKNVCFTKCFTICLFISPDLDGHRAMFQSISRNVILYFRHLCLYFFPWNRQFGNVGSRFGPNIKGFFFSKETQFPSGKVPAFPCCLCSPNTASKAREGRSLLEEENGLLWYRPTPNPAAASLLLYI